MPSAAARRSDRVSLTLLLETTGTDRHGHEFRTHAQSVISYGGAVIVLDRELQANQEIHIQRKAIRN